MCVMVYRVPYTPLFYDWVPYHCVWGGGGVIFDGWIQPPTPIGILILDISLTLVGCTRGIDLE